MATETPSVPEVVEMRKAFYRDGHARTLTLLLISFCMNALLIFILGSIFTHPPQPRYFPTSINGRITPLFALHEPNQSDSAVLQWANQAAIASFTYNFVNYRTELEATSGYFTATGWNQFLDVLQQPNQLDTVKSNKLVVSAVATRAPAVIQKGVLAGRYSWRVQMPILVTYQSAKEQYQTSNVVTMLISRVSTLTSSKGIAIAQFVVGPANSGIGGQG
ncbi:MAG: type IVB secretion system apparatus protein IcmL/DotI [Gammaproteobacteria bacterium]|nr:type IVB secretion system apparatus protein IcmL/DotI [Gammaproteobacteria bacterium]